jgi:hypothetical protein
MTLRLFRLKTSISWVSSLSVSLINDPARYSLVGRVGATKKEACLLQFNEGRRLRLATRATHCASSPRRCFLAETLLCNGECCLPQAGKRAGGAPRMTDRANPHVFCLTSTRVPGVVGSRRGGGLRRSSVHGWASFRVPRARLCLPLASEVEDMKRKAATLAGRCLGKEQGQQAAATRVAARAQCVSEGA